MPSISDTFGREPITEKQRGRLLAIAFGTRERPGALFGNRRQQANQLNEMLESLGYDWGAVDGLDGKPLTRADYDDLIEQLEVIRRGGGA